MGATSSSLRPEDIDELQRKSNFSAKEIKRLYKRFQKLDRSDSGLISVEDFLSIPELAMNPLVSRVVSLFDTDYDGHVNFNQFLSTLSVFSKHGDPKEKLRFAFRIYDVNNDGFISADELEVVVKMMVGANLTDAQLKEIVEKTIAEADRDGDGKLSFTEFQEVVGQSDIDQKLTLRI